MTEYIAPIHYKDLSEMDPGGVCRRAVCHYDIDRRCYELDVWGDTYSISPYEGTVHCHAENAPPAETYFPIFIVHYLLTAAELEIENEWISEKDIPGGATFFRGPHAIPTDHVTQIFQNDVAAFGRRCSALHGEPVEMGDAAFRFQITTRIPAIMLYWQGDEEFEPEARILFDRSIHRHLALDVIYALAVEMCARVGRII